MSTRCGSGTMNLSDENHETAQMRDNGSDNVISDKWLKLFERIFEEIEVFSKQREIWDSGFGNNYRQFKKASLVYLKAMDIRA